MNEPGCPKRESLPAPQEDNLARPQRRKLVYLSGTRADFGLMRSTLLTAAQDLHLSVAVTGMHLDRGFSHTVDEIEAAGLRVCGRVPLDLAARDQASMARAIGQCVIGMTELLQRERPDLLLLLGDRGEMLAGAIAALHLGIVTAHVHGGERSGTVDEPVRHAISKLCTYHFVATEQSRERLLRMGEPAEQIHVTGAPGLDDVLHSPAPDSLALRGAVGLPLEGRFVLVVFHPVVQQAGEAGAQTAALAEAVRALGLPALWLAPNADAGSGDILTTLDAQGLPAGSVRATHLPRPLFTAALRDCAALAGNSSAGIIEASSFGTPVVNIGDRQRLRERNDNVIDVPVQAGAIDNALREALRRGRGACANRYGDGQTAPRIATLLRTLPLDAALLEKVNTY